MQASLIIPVWNGAEVILNCLRAVYAHSGKHLLEVIAVDNDSSDNSAQLIRDMFPQVILLQQPINLGFAGGVNAGLDVAQGDVCVLLNQDCEVKSGWLTALIQALYDHPECGIAGCTILNADSSLNHTGAMIRRPDAYGIHTTDRGDDQPRPADYITGAVFALRRSTWQTVGRFDDGFYPAYYEESDYCYRARRQGIQTLYVPQAEAVHLLSNREWQTDPIRHTANQHLSRYRFVTKHFDSHEIDDFFRAELAAAAEDRYLDQATGRTLAARATVRTLADILERRRVDCEEVVSAAHRRQLQVGFTQVLRRSLAQAEQLIGPPAAATPQSPATEQLQALQQREYDLVKRIYFKAPQNRRPESPVRRLFRLLVLRPINVLTGREHLLLAELNTVHVARLDQLMEYALALHSLEHQTMLALDRRLKLLELLTDYDYR